MNWFKWFLFIPFTFQILLAQSDLVEPQVFNQILIDSSFQKLDVRLSAEFEIVGHIPNFQQISITNKNFDELVLEKFNPNHPIMVTCFSGHRSKDAVIKLQNLGFKKIIELKGGIINWLEKGYKIE